VTDIDYVLSPSFATAYQYQQMVKTESNEKANELIEKIMESDGKTDTKLNRCFKVEKLQGLFLNKNSSFFFESFVEEVCTPFVPGGIHKSNLPAVVTNYDF